MTKTQALQEYAEMLGYNSIDDLKHANKKKDFDTIACRCGFLDYLDMLCKDHRITEKQYNNWCAPSWMY